MAFNSKMISQILYPIGFSFYMLSATLCIGCSMRWMANKPEEQAIPAHWVSYLIMDVMHSRWDSK